MSFVATAIGGSALIGAGASIYAGNQQANAAKGASAAQQDAANLAAQTSIAAGRDALSYLDPFRQYGLNAGSSLQQALYSPQQQQQQIETQRAALKGEVDRLKALVPKWETYQILSGKNASERRQSMFTQEYQIAQQKVAEAQAKLKTFEGQVPRLTAQANQAGPTIQESPWYQFQAELLGRTMDRHFAARGLTGSGFEAEEKRRGLIELGAGETERQFARLKGLYDVGANAATAGAGSITGTAQSVSNNQLAAGNAQAQGLLGVAGSNANAATGVANSVTGAVGAGLNYLQFKNLIAANSPTPTGTVRDPVYNGTDSGGSYDYLRPAPGAGYGSDWTSQYGRR